MWVRGLQSMALLLTRCSGSEPVLDLRPQDLKSPSMEQM